MKSLLALAIVFVAVGSLAQTSLAQMGGMGGGGMGGMGSSSPLEVVILLGDQYDFQTPPFISAQEIVRAFGPKEGMYIPYAPSLDSVRVDVSIPLPDGNQRFVVAEHSESLAGKPLADFKQATKLNALRFGINRVEFVVGKLEAGARIWLREPYRSEAKLSADSNMLMSICQSLAQSDPELPTGMRLDLYAAQIETDVMMDMGGMGMDGGMGMGGMGIDGGMGMGMDMGMGMGMDMGMGMGGGMGDMMGPEESLESLTDLIDQNAKARASLQKRIDALVAEIRSQAGEEQTGMRDQLAEVVRADLKLEQAIQKLDVRRVQLKLDQLRGRLSGQDRQRDEIVRQRVAKLLAQ